MCVGVNSIISSSTHLQVCNASLPFECTLRRQSSTGTSDEHLSLIEHLGPVHSKISSVIVTTPQAVALLDTMKCLSFTRAVNIPVLGLIENMSGYVCPCCGEVTNVFSTGGGQEMARRENLTFLGSLPVDTELVSVLDGSTTGDDAAHKTPFVMQSRYSGTSSSKLFQPMVKVILGRLQELQGNLG